MPAERLAGDPAAIVVMGVSGSGKSAIGSLLAVRLGWIYDDGDWLHPLANIAKMHRGEPLGDADRRPWLRAIASVIDEFRARGGHVVVACSALKRAYRDVLIGDRSDVRLVFLKGSQELIGRRLAGRDAHFMPPMLLASQFEALEEPQADERAIVVSIDAPPRAIVEAIVAKLREGD